MFKITHQGLNSIFNILSRQLGCVFWMRSLDWQQQLFVSSTYEDIWQRKAESLYENPSDWFDTLVKDDCDETFKKINSRIEFLDENCIQFRIITPCGTQKFINDISFIVCDLQNKPVAFAGIGEEITERQWNAGRLEVRDKYSDFSDIISNELSLSILPINTGARVSSHFFYLEGKKTHLTNKEHSCLCCLLNGMSAKQTAEQLHLSSRTIERHLDHVRDKLNCRTKLDLLNVLRQGILA